MSIRQYFGHVFYHLFIIFRHSATLWVRETALCAHFVTILAVVVAKCHAGAFRQKAPRRDTPVTTQSPSFLTLRIVSSQRITESICTGDEKKGGRRAVRQSLRTLSVASATLCVLSFSRKSLKLCASAFKNVPSGFSVCSVQSHFSSGVAFVLSVTLCELVNPLC